MTDEVKDALTDAETPDAFETLVRSEVLFTRRELARRPEAGGITDILGGISFGTVQLSMCLGSRNLGGARNGLLAIAAASKILWQGLEDLEARAKADVQDVVDAESVPPSGETSVGGNSDGPSKD